MGFTRFYWIRLGFTGFYFVLLGFYVVFVGLRWAKQCAKKSEGEFLVTTEKKNRYLFEWRRFYCLSNYDFIFSLTSCCFFLDLVPSRRRNSAATCTSCGSTANPSGCGTLTSRRRVAPPPSTGTSSPKRISLSQCYEMSNILERKSHGNINWKRCDFDSTQDWKLSH